jgi:MFS transporter, OCT family, solute carrier family 22 (organic cation transporter), member 4/5
MLCYYGLAYSSTNLAGDIFLNYILVILVEIPACLTGMFVVEWLGRRPIVNVTLMAGGVFCLAAGLIPQGKMED